MKSKSKMPKGEARPLGTKKEKGRKPSAAVVAGKEKSQEPQKVVDTPAAVEVDSSKSEPEAITQPVNSVQEQNMTLTFKSISKNGRSAIYGFGRNSVRFALTAFTDKTHPATISVSPSDGSFVEPATPKAQMTAEEKAAAKAARAALPKPTLAERIAKREAALAKDKAKLAAAGGM